MKLLNKIVGSKLLLPALFVLLTGIVFVKAAPYVKATPLGISNIGQIGGYKNPPMEGSYGGIAKDLNDNIYVTDIQNNRIQKYDNSGTFQQIIGSEEFGPYGANDGQLQSPRDVAVASNGDIYVADTYNSRIQKFNSAGVYQSQFGSAGGQNGQFNYPQGIALDSSNNIYVADTNNYRIQVFNSAGVYQSQFGSNGSADGQFSSPIDIVIDSSNNIYVADYSRIQKFDSNGVHLATFGAGGSGDGQFSRIEGIALDEDGNIFASDSNNYRIQKFNSAGVYQSQFGTYGYGDGQLDNPSGLVLDSNGDILVVDLDNERVQKFNSEGQFLSNIGIPETSIGAYDITADDDHNIYVPQIEGRSAGQFEKYSSAGSRLSSWDYGEERYAYVAAASSTALYSGVTSDGNTMKIVKTDLQGNFISEWDVGSLGLSIAVDNQDNVYWFNYEESIIYKYSSTGQLLDQIGEPGTGDGQISTLGDEGYFYNKLAVDTAGNVYISDIITDGESGYSRIQKFDTNGNFVTKWESDIGTAVQGLGSSPEGFLYAQLYQFDTNSSAIGKFDSNLEILTQYAEEPDEWTGNEFIGYGLAVGSNGRIYSPNISNQSIVILCDHDVSTDNCASTGSPGGGPDTDSDGITNSVEDAAPNAGDGNNDGTPDADQTNVTSLLSPVSNSYVTAIAPEGSTLSNVTLSNENVANTTNNDVAYSYPFGIISFTLTNITPGSSNTVSFIHHNPPTQDLTTYTARKHNPTTNTIFTLTQADHNLSITKLTIDNKPVISLSFTITDGGPLDQDNTANGTIVDPVGLAQASVGVPNTGL